MWRNSLLTIYRDKPNTEGALTLSAALAFVTSISFMLFKRCHEMNAKLFLIATGPSFAPVLTKLHLTPSSHAKRILTTASFVSSID